MNRLAGRLGALICIATSLAACGQAETPAAGGGGWGAAVVSVAVAQAQSQTFTDNFTALGTVEADEAVELTSRVSSVVEKIRFTEGQFVEAGTLLVELDNREIAAQVAVAEAALDKIRTQYERSQALMTTRAVSQAELDELAADMRRAEADLRAARARLEDTFIRAPIAGYVGLRQVSPGDLVGPDTRITTLDDTRTVKLEFTVPEAWLATIEPGMRVEARSSVFPDERFAGTVATLDSRVDPVTRSVTVVAEIPNPDNMLKPGMFMTVDVQRERESVLLIPEEALAPRAGRQYVYVVDEGGTVTEREVTLGVRAPGQVEVRDGLEDGDLVVTEGVQKVRTGVRVEILEGGA